MRVLLVEDEAVLRAQLKQMLEQAGYAVDEAGDGQAALHLGATEPYDAVVLDLGLPVLDGLTVLQRWRGQGLSVPVLILTARDSWHEKVAGIDAGADDYLAKPFHTEELLARLRALVRRSHGLASPLLQQGDVTLDTRTGTVALKGITVTLTAHGYRLLGISGFSQYDKLFADVELWLREGWLDYLAPQLYWPRAQTAQAFDVLLQAWRALNPLDRPIHPGLFTSRIDASPQSWTPDEILGQIDSVRRLSPGSGHIHFSLVALTQNRKGVADALRTGPYAAR